MPPGEVPGEQKQERKRFCPDCVSEYNMEANI